MKAIDASLIEVNMTSPITAIGYTKKMRKNQESLSLHPLYRDPQGYDRGVT